MDKGEYWWELRPCKYYSQFENPKIVYPSVSQNGRFTLDLLGTIVDKTCYFVARHDLYLLGLLNSKLLFFYFSRTAVQRRGGYYEYLTEYVQQLPIRSIDPTVPADVARHERMVGLVQRMLELHKSLAAASTPFEKERLQRQIEATDRQIDALVYELYGLTDAEIEIVERSGGT